MSDDLPRDPAHQVDVVGGQPHIWVRNDGTIHIGDEELSWRLAPEHARLWAKVLWKKADVAEEIYNE